MTGPGAAALRDALNRRRDDLVQATIATATVTAVAARQITVQFPNATGTQAWPRLRSYSDAAVGDVVILLGRPGTWVVVGAIA